MRYPKPKERIGPKAGGMVVKPPRVRYRVSKSAAKSQVNLMSKSARQSRTEAELRDWYARAERGELNPKLTPAQEAEARQDLIDLLDAIDKAK
jgi:hypothetical protein